LQACIGTIWLSYRSGHDDTPLCVRFAKQADRTDRLRSPRPFTNARQAWPKWEDAPFSFSSSPEDDRAGAIDFVRDALGSGDQATFGAFAGELVGIVGICRDRSEKGGHKCGIWGLYVSPHARSSGIGRALVIEALGFARSLEGVTHVFVSATDRAPESVALYESLGFVTWGVEPAAVRIGDVAVSEHHMVRTSEGALGPLGSKGR
jgi:ribosomal protein S18 acetylase RimI-like enzyme